MSNPSEYIKEKKISKELPNTGSSFVLVLFNDDYNTFDHVIESLVDICLHDDIQANQCALIAHHKGQCEVKESNSYQELKTMKQGLVDNGLNAVIKEK